MDSKTFFLPPEICPECGARVPPNATACPECGSDAQTGWSDEASAANLDLPDDEFDYNEFAEREFGKGKAKPYGIGWFWWVVALLLGILFLVFSFW